MFDSNRGKELRAKQIKRQDENKKNKNNVGQLARKGKDKKHKYINVSTSPIIASPNTQKYSFSTKKQEDTFFEYIRIRSRSQKVSNYESYPNLKILSIGLVLLSLSAYIYLKQFIMLPHERTVEKWIHDDIQKQKGAQFELTNIDNIIEEYIKENNISENLKVVLAVDAFSVKPNLIVEENGIVRGTINDEQFKLKRFFH